MQTDSERAADTEGFGPPLYYVVPAIVLAAADSDRGAAIRRIGVVSFRELAEIAARPGLPIMDPRWVGFPHGTEPNLFVHPPGGPLAARPVRAIHLMRLFSTLCGLATLAAVFLLAREVAPGRPEVQLLGVALVAFNPQFVYLSGLLNNDSLVTAFATIALWWTVRLVRRVEPPSAKDAILLGACLGLGALSKPNMLFVALPVAAAFWWRCPGFREFSRALALALGVAVALGAWFYVRNAWLYGGLDFFGWRTRSVLHPFFVLPPEQRLRMLTQVLPEMLFTTYWGRFGWLTLRLPAWQYAFYGLVTLLSVASLLPSRGKRSTDRTIVLVLLWGTVAANLGSLLAFNFTFWAEQGRLLFPSIGAFAILMALGFEKVSILLFPRLRFTVAVYVLAGALLASVLFAHWAVIYPVYFRLVS